MNNSSIYVNTQTKIDVLFLSSQSYLKLNDVKIQKQKINTILLSECSINDISGLILENNDFTNVNSTAIFEIFLCMSSVFSANNFSLITNKIFDNKFMKFSGDNGKITFQNIFYAMNNIFNRSSIFQFTDLVNCTILFSLVYEVFENFIEKGYFFYFNNVTMKEKILFFNNITCYRNLFLSGSDKCNFDKIIDFL